MITIYQLIASIHLGGAENVAFQLAVNNSRNELSEDITPLAEKIKLLEQELDSVLVSFDLSSDIQISST